MWLKAEIEKKSTFHDELVAAVNGTTGSQLSKEEGEQMLGLPVEHLGDFGEVGKGGLLAAHSHHLGRKFGCIQKQRKMGQNFSPVAAS